MFNINSVFQGQIEKSLETITKNGQHLIVSAPPGIGLTYKVKEFFQKHPEYKTAWVLSGISLFSLYSKIWECQNSETQFLIVDEPDFNDKGIRSLLKTLLDPITAFCQWSNPDIAARYNIPSSFEFKKQVIILTNCSFNTISPKKTMMYNDMVALRDRARYIESEPIVDEKEELLSKAYKTIFLSNEGKFVLNDLERIINQTKLDAENINPNTAVWKCAQQALVQRIKNQIK